MQKENPMTRDEHLQWAKERALAFLPADLVQAWASFTSDLGKHRDLGDCLEIQTDLGTQLLCTGNLDTPEKMAKWIEGFR